MSNKMSILVSLFLKRLLTNQYTFTLRPRYYKVRFLFRELSSSLDDIFFGQNFFCSSMLLKNFAPLLRSNFQLLLDYILVGLKVYKVH